MPNLCISTFSFRTSSAAEYSAYRNLEKQRISKDLLGPVIMGSIISVDEWIPERPPKNPMLRVPSPDLPPFPKHEPDNNTINQDEPLPPPPPEILHHLTVGQNTPVFIIAA